MKLLSQSPTLAKASSQSSKRPSPLSLFKRAPKLIPMANVAAFLLLAITFVSSVNAGCSANFGSEYVCCGQQQTVNDYTGHVQSCPFYAPTCDGYSANNHYGTCTKTQCSADHNSEDVCCGQPESSNDYSGHVKSCPVFAPTCVDYQEGKNYGMCVVRGQAWRVQLIVALGRPWVLPCVLAAAVGCGVAALAFFSCQRRSPRHAMEASAPYVKIDA